MSEYSVEADIAVGSCKYVGSLKFVTYERILLEKEIYEAMGLCKL